MFSLYLTFALAQSLTSLLPQIALVLAQAFVIELNLLPLILFDLVHITSCLLGLER